MTERLFSIAGLGDLEDTGWPDPAYLHPDHHAPNPLMAGLHDRMPAILLPEHEQLWLSSDLPTGDVHQLLIPFPAEHMHAFPVSGRVNRVTEQDPALINPLVRNF